MDEFPELKQILKIQSELSNHLNKFLSSFDFGDLIDQFIIFIISVDDDELVNKKFANSHNKLSKYKNPFTKETVRLLSISVEIPHTVFKNASQKNIKTIICEVIPNQIPKRPKRLPKGFDFDNFSRHISNTISSYIE